MWRKGEQKRASAKIGGMMVEKDERHLGHTLIPHAYADKKGAQTSQTGRQRERER